MVATLPLARRRAVLPCFLAWALLFGVRAQAATPASGTLTDQQTTLSYTGGPYAAPNVTAQANGTPICTAPNSCDIYTLTVQVAATDLQSKQIAIAASWPNTTADFDLYVFDSNNNLVNSSASSADPESTLIPAVSGVYTIEVVPFNPLGQTFTGTILLQNKPTAPGQGTGVPPRFQVYPAPVSAGDAERSGEPSLGVDWNPNVSTLTHGKVNVGGATFFTSNFRDFRVSFDDCSSPAVTTWTNVTSPVETDPASLDPIGFCDHYGASPTPGRVFQSQLAGPAGSVMAFSDDDGNTWTQSQGAGQPAGVDHQSVGAGPYNPNATPPPPAHPLYPNAVYYCSQDLATAFCARSDDGGLTFGPGVPAYNLTTCGGIHGHIKVAPDGTVYVPNGSCGAHQGVAVSTDNGLTWSVRPILDSTPVVGVVDPSLGIATDGTVYFGYQDGSGHPKIAVSHDRGLTWAASVDVSGPFAIQNSTFPEVVAGDPARAAFMYLGTPTGGNYQDPTNFHGIWHAYVSTTYDGGKSYITVDATPAQPVQVGSICNLGTTGCSNNAVGGADRNMLDFMDLTLDKQGRVMGAFAAGCVAGACDPTSPPSASRGALATIVRQSGGRRLFHSFDPAEPAVPGAPQAVSAYKLSSGVLVTWSAPDNGGAAITAYKIYRSTTSGAEKLLKTVSAAKTSYMDTTAKPTSHYFYKVAAVNKSGTSSTCRELSETNPPATQSACKLPGITVVQDASGDQVGGPSANTQLDLKSVSIAEPFTSTTAPGMLTFTISTPDLNTPVQPNSFWKVLFTAPNGTEYFVDMDTTQGTPQFEYGHVAAGSETTDGAADPSSSYNANGTIRIVVANSNVGGVHAGDQLVNVHGETQILLGAGGGLLQTIDTTRPGRYVLIGNQGCAP